MSASPPPHPPKARPTAFGRDSRFADRVRSLVRNGVAAAKNSGGDDRQFELHRSFSTGRPQKTQRHGVSGSARRLSTQSQASPGGMNLSGLYFFTIFHE